MLTRKSPMRRKRPEMRACVSRPSPGPALLYSLSRGSLERQSKSGGHRDGPSRVSTLVFVGERPVPHLLVALFTPTRAPHARLPKLWAGRTVSLLALPRPPHARFLLLFCAPSPASCSILSCTFHSRFFFLLSQNVSLSLQNVSLSLFPHSQNVSPHRTSLSLQNVPLSPFPLRTSLLTERLFISSGRLYGVPSAPSSPHPTGARLP